MKTFLSPQRGVTLVTAIFLLVVLAGLGVAMVTLSTSQQKSSALDVTGVHAYLAAKTGLEWGLFRALRSGSCDGTMSNFQVPINAPSNYFVTVTCQTTTQLSIVRRRVTATACNRASACDNVENNPDYVQRVLSADF